MNLGLQNQFRRSLELFDLNKFILHQIYECCYLRSTAPANTTFNNKTEAVADGRPQVDTMFALTLTPCTIAGGAKKFHFHRVMHSFSAPLRGVTG